MRTVTITPAQPTADRALCVAGHITFDLATRDVEALVEDHELIPLVDYLLQVKAAQEPYYLPDDAPAFRVLELPE